MCEEFRTLLDLMEHPSMQNKNSIWIYSNLYLSQFINLYCCWFFLLSLGNFVCLLRIRLDSLQPKSIHFGANIFVSRYLFSFASTFLIFITASLLHSRKMLQKKIGTKTITTRILSLLISFLVFFSPQALNCISN